MRANVPIISALTVVLTILGLGLLALSHSGRVSKIVDGHLDIVIELTSDYLPADRIKITAALSANARIKPGSVTFVDKAEALRMMTHQRQDSLVIKGNPFSDIITFNLRPDDYEEAVIDKLTVALQKMAGVSTVSARSPVAREVSELVRRIGWGTTALGMLLALLAMTLISSSIRMRVQADQEKIYTMRLVGARPSYILMPYRRVALVAASVATLCSGIILIVFAFIVDSWTSDLIAWWIVFALIICLGVIAITYCSFVTTRAVHLASHHRED